MKKLLYIFAILTCSLAAKASDSALEADSAYNELAYSRALQLYEETLDSLGASADLYYNLGNTYYRLQQPGKAILWYERALLLDPTHKDAKYNLDFVNTTITDKPIDNRSLIARKFQSLVDSLTPDTWAWLAVIFFAITTVGVVVYLVSNEVHLRKICFFGGMATLGVTIILTVISSISASKVTGSNYAIVISPAASLSTTPRAAVDPSTQAFLLHEGTKVELVDSLIKSSDKADCWYEVKIGDGARAWINGEDIERI